MANEVAPSRGRELKRCDSKASGPGPGRPLAGA